MSPQQPICTPLDASTEVWTFPGEREVSHLLVRGEDAILIDCHRGDLPGLLGALPLPKLIVHTHIAPEHCAQGGSFPAAQVLVHAPDAVLAYEPQEVAATVAAQRADLENWGTLFGREPYGIAGCQTEFPPTEPLPRGGTFCVGETLRAGVLEVRVIALPFHGRHAVGFVALGAEGERLAVFTGDLLLRGGYLVDAVSTLENYVSDRLERLPGLLDEVASYGRMPLFPATGAPMVDPDEALWTLRTLAAGVRAFLIARRGLPPKERPDVLVRVGRFRQVSPGVYNLEQFGNAIVLIDEEGRGLLVDPGPCDYGNPEREQDFLADLAALEAQAGLRVLEWVLITHYHGDHVDMTHLVRQRYPQVQVATWEKVADVLERPDEYPCSAKLPWYGVGVTTVPVDVRLPLGHGFAWRERPIEVLHLPGHAWAHCGFLLRFRGRSLAITGDTVQISTQADTLGLVVTNRAAPTQEEGNIKAYRELATRQIDLNLGGHGAWFEDCAPLYQASLLQIERAQAALVPLFEPGRIEAAYRLRASC